MLLFFNSMYFSRAFLAIGAATSEPYPPFSTNETIETSGLFAGINPANQECGDLPPVTSAVPVFPATNSLKFLNT